MSSNLVTPIEKVTSTLNSHESGHTIAHNSKKDRKLNYVLSVQNVASRLGDVTKELQSLVDIFSDAKNLSRKQTSALRSLQSTIIPFISKSSTHLLDSTKELAPIPIISYVHSSRRNEAVLAGGMGQWKMTKFLVTL